MVISEKALCRCQVNRSTQSCDLLGMILPKHPSNYLIIEIWSYLLSFSRTELNGQGRTPHACRFELHGPRMHGRGGVLI
jgi:hypothetical protein